MERIEHALSAQHGHAEREEDARCVMMCSSTARVTLRGFVLPISPSLFLYISLSRSLSHARNACTHGTWFMKGTQSSALPRPKKNKLAAIYAEALKNENPRKSPLPPSPYFSIFCKAYTCIPTKGRAPPKIFVALMGLILSGISRRFQPFSTPPPTQPCRPVP